MIVPQRAPVRPRVYMPLSGETAPLEDEVHRLLVDGITGRIWLSGPAGAGKTAALCHLAAVFADAKRLALADTDEPELAIASTVKLVVCTAPGVLKAGSARSYQLAPWNLDECLEYLLAAHRTRCGSVLNRLRASGGLAFIDGRPELCRIVLDTMARHEDVPDVRAALRRYGQSLGVPGNVLRDLEQYCLESLLIEVLSGPSADSKPPESISGPLERLVRHRPVQLLAAADRIANDLATGAKCKYLAMRLTRDLIQETAALVAGCTAAQDHLHQLITESSSEFESMAASLLHRLPGGWKPTGGLVILTGAYLDGAHWPGVSLENATLSDADLSQADLAKANLERAQARRTQFQGANLHRASLLSIDAQKADFTGANLSHLRAVEADLREAVLCNADLSDAALDRALLQQADLRGACLAGARLHAAQFAGANIEDADFSGADFERANLTGLTLRLATVRDARFPRAHLGKCDLEYIELPGGDFTAANLEGALLTGTRMPGANFTDACLQSAGLAEIDWENACLRGADLRGTTFHLGSSRSGLVGSPIASEGSRTGFYTDDFTEQDFKSPEEIRKANLCGADLRDAQLDDVDFYLVDLRRARYDSEQEAHFRRCGAILEDQQ